MRAVLSLLVCLTVPVTGQSALPPCTPNVAATSWTNCQGAYTGPHGDKYVGAFRDGKRHGRGTYTFADGHKYVGEFRDGERHGQGTSTWADGNKYVGEFREDKFHGRGMLTFAEGRAPQEGVWENHKFVTAERIPPGIAGKPTPSQLLSPARKKCRELGISPETEKFGECVLRLSK